MKNTPLAICLLVFACCTLKEKGESQTPASSSNYLSMKINGVEWKAERDIMGSLGVLKPGEFVLAGETGTKKIGQLMNIVIQNVTGPGTYKTNTADVYNVFQFTQNAEKSDFKMFKSQQDGLMTIVIKRCTGTATEGTFSGTIPPFLNASEPIVITEGKFRTE